MIKNEVFQALNRLEEYIEKERYHGYDPYDALSSPIFKLPILRNIKLLRFSVQQAVKRSPINLRPLLFVPKGYNPVTLGLILHGNSYQLMLKEIPDQARNVKLRKIEFLIEELYRLQYKGFSRGHYYKKELELRMSSSYGPGRYDSTYKEKGTDYPIGYMRWTENRNMQVFINLLAKSKLNIEPLITHVYDFENAPEVYDMILEKKEAFVGILLKYNIEKKSEKCFYVKT